MSRLPILVTKILLSVALIWYAFSQVDVSAAMTYLGKVPSTVIFVAFFILFSEFIIAALRLRILLRLLGTCCSVTKAMDVVMIGAFFSQTLISFVGGDAMRIWRMVQSKTPLGLAAKGVLFDRAAGFAGLIVVIVACLPWLLELVPQPSMRMGLVAAILMGVVGIAALFLTGFMPKALLRWKTFQWTSELSGVAFAILRDRKGLLSLTVLSITIHLLNIVVLYVMARGLGMAISFLSLLVLVPPVLLVSMLPVSVAGWGVREGAMVFALNLVGSPPYQSLALSICFGLSVLAVSLPGGVLWFITRKRMAPETAQVVGLSTKD